MVLAAFMLAISSLVISALAFVNANFIESMQSTMIDKFDSVETQWRYDREVIYNKLKLMKKNGKPRQDKKGQKKTNCEKSVKKKTKRIKTQRKKA